MTSIIRQPLDCAEICQYALLVLKLARMLLATILCLFGQLIGYLFGKTCLYSEYCFDSR